MFSARQSQGTCDRVEHTPRRTGIATLFERRVPADADAGQDGDLFTTKPREPSGDRWEGRLVPGTPQPAEPEELAQLAATLRLGAHPPPAHNALAFVGQMR
ncbi:hypothetical protein GCM10010464_38490 [Pseudonocardia yunnanensis]